MPMPATVTSGRQQRSCVSHLLELGRAMAVAAAFVLVASRPLAAQERLCDNSYEDCRASIIQMIRAENVGLDVSMWFMTDTRYSIEIIKQMLDGKLPGAPRLYFGVVDVRDVAGMQVKAMTAPEAKGERFLAIAGEPVSIYDMSVILQHGMGEKAAKVTELLATADVIE